MEMPGRVFESSGGYRFGFNGQEKTSELGQAHTTALYWEYDGRLGRRWNMDPKITIGLSVYATFKDNPVLYIDPLGNIWKDQKAADELKSNIETTKKDLVAENQNLQKQIDDKENPLSKKESERKNKQIVDNKNRIDDLTKSAASIDRLGNDQQNTYDFAETDKLDHHVYKKDGIVYIEGTGNALKIHEIRHIDQSLDKGMLSFENETGNLLYANKTNNVGTQAKYEADAYRAQYSYDTGSLPENVDSFNNIDLRYVGSLRNGSTGAPLYPQIFDQFGR
jgi:RHS repeat-associated protein